MSKGKQLSRFTKGSKKKPPERRAESEVCLNDGLSDPFEKACKLLADITDCPYIYDGTEMRDECNGAEECCEIWDKGEAYKCWAEHFKQQST